MSVRHPGVRWFETMPGTEMNGRIRHRYADGVSPIRRLKRTLKLPRLEKPTSMQTSVTERSPVASRCLASSSRDACRN